MEEDQPMNVDEMMQGVRDAITVKRVYGDPIERDGTTIIPAARLRGGGGGGGDNAQNGGGGFGITARPVGAYVVRNGEVTWQPAVDVSRIAVGGQIVAALALLVVFMLLRGRRG
jgi:uncharacterized spore protein YtfJ